MISSQRAKFFRSVRDPSDLAGALMAELDRILIAGRIKQARESAGLTQPELADVLQTHMRTVQNWESQKGIHAHNVPFDRLGDIADVTGVTQEWLLHGREQPASGAVDSLRAVHEEIGELRSLIERNSRLLERLLDAQQSPGPNDEDPRVPDVPPSKRAAQSRRRRNANT